MPLAHPADTPLATDVPSIAGDRTCLRTRSIRTAPDKGKERGAWVKCQHQR